jgi:indolepyruvate ferredoxin oxidoreductase beta subunit
MDLNILYAGVGGQGIITSAVVVGEASIKEGIYVTMSEIHGLSQRGGTVNVEMKIGDSKSPLIEDYSTDVVIGMEPVEVYRLSNKLNHETEVILNVVPIVPFTVSIGSSKYPDVNDLISYLEKNFKHIYKIDVEDIASKAGNKIAASMVFVGCLAGLKITKKVIKKESFEEAIKEHFPKKFHDVNLKAFELGYQAMSNPE